MYFLYVLFLVCSYCYVLYGSLLFVFFFFKQKTAYEMRISDWSSDVCSSDLGERHLHHRMHGPPRMSRREPGCGVRNLRRVGRERTEIGRASCRERVCQYV